jgi:hypothetical protein
MRSPRHSKHGASFGIWVAVSTHHSNFLSDETETDQNINNLDHC